MKIHVYMQVFCKVTQSWPNPPTPLIEINKTEMYDTRISSNTRWASQNVQTDNTQGSASNSMGLWVEQLVALLFPLETFDSLVVHLLCHLVVSFLFLLGGSAFLDPLDMGLLSVISIRTVTTSQCKLTWRSASFSSFSSFSCSLMASCCLRSSCLFANEVMPAAGRKGFLASCQFLPAGTPETLANEKIKKHGTWVSNIVPFFLMPLTGAGAVEGAVVAVDMIKIYQLRNVELGG